MRRGAVWYALITVPTDVQPSMSGQKQKWISLRTTDYAEAKRRKSAVVDEWMGTFDDMRRRKQLSPADLATAIWDHYSTAVAAGDSERSSRPRPADVRAAKLVALSEAVNSGLAAAGQFAVTNAITDLAILANKSEWAARRRMARLARLRADLGTGDTRLIETDADAFLAANGFQIAKGGEQYRELCTKLMRADIEQLERYSERDRGDFTGKPQDPIVTEPTEQRDPIGAPIETIMALYDKFEKENPNEVRPETFRQTRRDVHHFVSFIGPRVAPAKIDRRMVRDWKEFLIDWPVKASEVTAWKGMTLAEIVAANKKLAQPKPAITRPTIRRYMSSLGGFCRWLVTNEYLASNPVADMLPKKLGPVNKRGTIGDGALQTLFATPLFNTCQGEHWRQLDVPGNVAVRDHRYWIPLIMAYSGARPAEIAQLHSADVRKEQGIWIMHITEDGEGGKRTKTEGSTRVVPIHSELIRLGFVKHCQTTAKAGHKQVFPEIEIPETGQIAAQFSREFNRYLTRTGVKTDKSIVVYSLRHTFIDKARLAGFMNDEIAIVVGHETGSSKRTITRGYGVEQEGTLKRRAEIVEAVQYP